VQQWVVIEPELTLLEKLLIILKSSAFVGLLTVCALLVSFNHKAFNKVFKTKGFIYWSLFFAFSFIPLGLMFLLWQFFFIRFGWVK